MTDMGTPKNKGTQDTSKTPKPWRTLTLPPPGYWYQQSRGPRNNTMQATGWLSSNLWLCEISSIILLGHTCDWIRCDSSTTYIITLGDVNVNSVESKCCVKCSTTPTNTWSIYTIGAVTLLYQTSRCTILAANTIQQIKIQYNIIGQPISYWHIIIYFSRSIL